MSFDGWGSSKKLFKGTKQKLEPFQIMTFFICNTVTMSQQFKLQQGRIDQVWRIT